LDIFFRNVELGLTVSPYRFPPAKNETVGFDPIIGQVGANAARTMTGLNPRNAAETFTVPQYLRTLGGEYFFSPSIPALISKISV